MSDLLKSYNNKLATTQNEQAFYTLIVEGDNLYDETTRYIILDKVDSPKISMQSNITSYPLLNGDVISDHKYDMPISISLSGTFSLNGRFNDTFINYDGDTTRLENIMDYFENVRKYGKKITLISQVNNQNRFKVRKNLVLKAISWTPNINTIDFTFDLQEIYYGEFEEDIKIDENLRDPNAPTYSEFLVLDFTDDVLSTEGIYQMIVKYMNEAGLINASFWNAFLEIATSWDADAMKARAVMVAAILTTIGAASAISATIGTSAALGTALATSSTNPVGWVIAGVIVSCIVGFSIYKAIKKSQYINSFKDLGNYDENKKECERFIKLLTNVKEKLDDLEPYLNCYGFSSNTNKQQTYLTIDNITYIFSFEKDNTSGNWQMTISDTNGNIISTSTMVGNSALLDCQKSDVFLATSNGTYCYLINKGITIIDSCDDDIIKSWLVDYFKANDLEWLGYDNDTLKQNTTDNEEPTSSFLNQLLEDYKNGGYLKNLTFFEIICTKSDLSEMRDNISSIIDANLKKGAND